MRTLGSPLRAFSVSAAIVASAACGSGDGGAGAGATDASRDDSATTGDGSGDANADSDGSATDVPADALGATQVLAAGQTISSPWGIAVDATDVYWTDFNGIRAVLVGKCATGGCSGKPTVFVPAKAGQGGAAGIALDATAVYFTLDVDNGSVLKCAKSGCPGGPTVLATSLNHPVAIAVDATSVYWVNDVGGSVMKCAIGGCGGTPTTLASGQSSPESIAVDATSVYWTRTQLVTETRVTAGVELSVASMGVPTHQTAVAPALTVVLTPQAVGRGLVMVTERSPLGTCTRSIRTKQTDSAAEIARKLEAAFLGTGETEDAGDGDHGGDDGGAGNGAAKKLRPSSCPARQNPRDVTRGQQSAVATLTFGLAHELVVTSTDPRVQLFVGSAGTPAP